MKLRGRTARSREGQLVPIDTAALERAENERLRREALIECVVTTVPVAILSARNEAWDQGWEAALRGLPKSANPVRTAG